jgi:NAD(P)-dependent dehydrogenase (short-subunit alcohol dehydrogenase family)
MSRVVLVNGIGWAAAQCFATEGDSVMIAGIRSRRRLAHHTARSGRISRTQQHYAGTDFGVTA